MNDFNRSDRRTDSRINATLDRTPDFLTTAFTVATAVVPPAAAGWWAHRVDLTRRNLRHIAIGAVAVWFLAGVAGGILTLLLAPLATWLLIGHVVGVFSVNFGVPSIAAALASNVAAIAGVALVDAWRRRSFAPTIAARSDQLTDDELAPSIARAAHADLDPAAWRVGVDVYTGEQVTVDAAVLANHGLGIGETGAGKTVGLVHLNNWRARTNPDQAQVIVDLKGSPDLVEDMRAIAAATGRDFKVFSIDTRPGQATWNPIANGDRTVNKDRLMDGYEWSEPYYQGKVEVAVQNIIGVLDDMRLPRSLRSLSVLLNPAKLKASIQSDEYTGDRKDELLAWVDQEASDKGAMSAWADMQSKLAQFLDADVGKMLSPNGAAEDRINLVDDLDNSAIVVFSLDSSSYPMIAQRIAAWVARELLIVGSIRRRRATVDRRPVLVVVDEFPAAPAAASQFAAGYQVARDANFSIWLWAQSMETLNTMGDDEAAIANIKANARVLMAFRDKLGAEELAQFTGTKQGWEPTMQTTEIGGLIDPVGAATTGAGSLRRVDEFVANPNTYRHRPDRQAVITVSGRGPDQSHFEPITVRVVPHATQPGIEAPEPPQEADVDDVVATPVRYIGGRPPAEHLRNAAMVGGLIAVLGVPYLLLRGDDTTPVEAAPAAAAGSTVLLSNAAIGFTEAWLLDYGPDRDAALRIYTKEDLGTAPVTATGPVSFTGSRTNPSDGVRFVTVSVPTAEGITGWEFGLFGADNVWVVTTPPVPVAPPARAQEPREASHLVDDALTDELEPILIDAIVAFGRDGSGDRARLDAVSSTPIRPIGGLTTSSSVAVTVAARGGDAATARIVVLWDQTGIAAYDAHLIQQGDRWLIGAITPAPFSTTNNRSEGAQS